MKNVADKVMAKNKKKDDSSSSGSDSDDSSGSGSSGSSSSSKAEEEDKKEVDETPQAPPQLNFSMQTLRQMFSFAKQAIR